MGDMIRVGAIDDDHLLLTLISQSFEKLPGLTLTHTAATVADYLKLNADDDVVMLDLNLRDNTRPRDNVSLLVRRGYKVLVVSVLADKEYVLATLEAGASDYLTKGSKATAPDLLARTIREIADGTHVLGHELAFLMSRDRRTNKPKLSHREEEVIKLYGQGLTLDAVAQQINVQRSTAKRYLERAQMKYQEVGRPFHNRTQLQQRLREDDIDPPPPL